MQNQQLSDVKGKELVAAGHAFAKAIGMDTPLIEIAKMMAELATRLDCALVRGDELQKERDALAAENAAMRNLLGATGFKSETPATDAYLNSVRAEGVEALTKILQAMMDAGDFVGDEVGAIAGAVDAGNYHAAQLRAGKDGE